MKSKPQRTLPLNDILTGDGVSTLAPFACVVVLAFRGSVRCGLLFIKDSSDAGRLVMIWLLSAYHPSLETEREERRRVFWGSFAIDRYSSVGTGWPILIDEKRY
jgi:hypothetical protein